MEKAIVFVFSTIAIIFSIGAFFVSNDYFLFGLLDFTSLILLAFALMIYKEAKHGHKHSFLESINEVGHMKSIGGIFGLVYLFAIASNFTGFNNNDILFAILIMFTCMQVMAGFLVMSFIIWD